MAWRPPRFGILHAARLAGASALSVANSSDPGTPLAYLVDGFRVAHKMSADAVDHHLQLDRGAGTLEAIDRMFIPEGHNYDGEEIKVEAADDAAFTSNVTEILAATTISGTGLIDETLTSNTQRYVRMTLGDGVSLWTPETPEWVLTRTRVTSQIGPNPRTWPDTFRPSRTRIDLPSGVSASIVKGAMRRFFRFDYDVVDNAADQAVLDDLLVGGQNGDPILLDPPFDDEPALWVQFDDDAVREFDHPAPQKARGYRYTFALIEVAG